VNCCISRSMKHSLQVPVFLMVLAGFAEHGRAADGGDLVVVRTDGSTTSLKAGETGRLALTVSPRGGAHVSAEAPLRIDLSSNSAKLDKARLTLADARSDGNDARFEVGFTPVAHGPMRVDARLNFFVCTPSTCERQIRSVSVEVLVQ